MCCQVMLDTDCGKSPTDTNRVSAAVTLASKDGYIVEPVRTKFGGIPYLFDEIGETGDLTKERATRQASYIPQYSPSPPPTGSALELSIRFGCGERACASLRKRSA